MIDAHSIWDWKIGDIATWFGAAASAAAAWAARNAAKKAVDIARIPLDEEEKRRQANSLVMASYFFAYFEDLRQTSMATTLKLKEVNTFPDLRAKDPYRHALSILQSVDVSRLRDNMDKISGLPARHAIGLASVPDMVDILKEALLNVLEEHSAKKTPDANFVNALHATSQRTTRQTLKMTAIFDAFFDEYERQFVGD